MAGRQCGWLFSHAVLQCVVAWPLVATSLHPNHLRSERLDAGSITMISRMRTKIVSLVCVEVPVPGSVVLKRPGWTGLDPASAPRRGARSSHTPRPSGRR